MDPNSKLISENWSKFTIVLRLVYINSKMNGFASFTYHFCCTTILTHGFGQITGTKNGVLIAKLVVWIAQRPFANFDRIFMGY